MGVLSYCFVFPDVSDIKDSLESGKDMPGDSPVDTLKYTWDDLPGLRLNGIKVRDGEEVRGLQVREKELV